MESIGGANMFQNSVLCESHTSTSNATRIAATMTKQALIILIMTV